MGKAGGANDDFPAQPQSGSSSGGGGAPYGADPSRGMSSQQPQGGPEPSPGYPVSGQYGVPQQFADAQPGYVPNAAYTGAQQYGAPVSPFDASGHSQYASSSAPLYPSSQPYPSSGQPYPSTGQTYGSVLPPHYANPPPGYPASSNVQPGYPAGSPPSAQMMSLQSQQQGGGYPPGPVVTMVYQNTVPPGAPPGGMWGTDRFCGPITWTAFLCTWLWVCLPCPFCLCPCDDRQVYYAPDGRKYLPNGTVLTGTMSDAFAGM